MDNNMQNNNNNKNNNNKDDFNWNRVFKIVLGWSAILIGFFLLMIYTKGTDAKYSEVSFNKYQQFLSEGKIQSATVKKSEDNYEFIGTLRQPEAIDVNGKPYTIDKFNVFLPYTNVDDAVIKSWSDKGVDFTIEKDDGGWLGPLLSALPWILIL